MSLAAKAFNFVAFELAWLAAVMGGAAGMGLLASLPAVAVVAVHLAQSRDRWRAEARLAAAVTVLGLVLETGFINAGLIAYVGGTAFPPVWILALWFGFATLPNASLSWLKGRWLLQALLGLVAGPLTYWGGVGLGAATLPGAEARALLIIALAWVVAMPAIFLLAERLAPDRTEPPAP